MANKYLWNLNDSQFTWLDRLKICKFFLNPKNRWTQDVLVKEFEKKMAKLVGAKYAVFVSSGSTANTLLAMYVRDHIYSQERNRVILPAVTWQTSCAPWIREKFEPVFIDVNLKSLSMDLKRLEEYLEKNHDRVAAVFITSLLGFCPDMERLTYLKDRHPSVKFLLDNCESNLTTSNVYGTEDNVSSFFTSTTSTYFGHEFNSCEGGFVFCNKLEKYIYLLIARNHGMVRSLNAYRDILGNDVVDNEMSYRRNQSVDERFDFCLSGNNFRNTEINALLGLLDLERAQDYVEKRKSLYLSFSKHINDKLFLIPTDENNDKKTPVPFSLPIIFNPKLFNNSTREKTVKFLENELKIETRPIISGNLLRQTVYKHYGNPSEFINAEVLHTNGLYVGLHSKIYEEQIQNLCYHLNNIAEKEA